MKYSIEQSEITERTEQINKFALLVDLFNKKAVDRETFLAELSKIEQTDRSKENLFNQLIGYCVLGDAYGILKSRELDFSKAYYNNEYVSKDQLQILDMQSFIKTPEALRDLNKVISDYFVQMADAELDRMWNEGTLNEERIESFRYLHERTPYNKPIL